MGRDSKLTLALSFVNRGSVELRKKDDLKRMNGLVDKGLRSTTFLMAWDRSKITVKEELACHRRTGEFRLRVVKNIHTML